MNLFALVKLIFGIMIPFLLGFTAVCCIKRDNLLENIGLSYPLGIGILGLLMLLLMPFYKLSLISILLLTLPVYILFIILNIFPKRNASFKLSPSNKINKFSILLLIYLFIKVGWVFTSALIKPVLAWDAVARYSRIVKGIFFKGTYFTPYLHVRIEDYPPLVMVNQAWMLFCQGNWNDIATKAIGPMLFISLLIIVYVNLRKNLSVNISLLGASLLASIPFMDFHATTAYLDFAMMAFYSIGAIYLLRYFRDHRRNDLFVSFAFLGIGIWAKRAGLYLAGISLILLIIFLAIHKRNEIKKYWIIFLALLLLSIPWIIFNQLTSERHYYSLSAMLSSASLSALAERSATFFAVVSDKLFFSGNWHLLWAGLIIVCILFYKKLPRMHNLFGIGLILLSLLAIFYPLIFTGAFNFILDGTLLNRVILYLVPLVIFFSFNLYGDKAEESKKKQ
ncbi:MAG: glycosyltransferase family 39 protein [Candidatus Margulisbacteria bacterium]|nr:glycosyltransferase family 39 protein [Candidatus Margulisiibacteriota bacterium]MBU1021107.1 glycosyltransferase family 39 protein [Candidatus Margulisiibacteriota bacterium]MBU1728662.1 glycosyltransferase family 39 protein [Candidatus Margulisiibacteriota bacterium]MBU1955113.1 glycosyltransferase family 39 protein [Candidatus Margulisiibacteriota bacterium]